MKYLGIDYGSKFVGIAISDDDGSFAFPKTVVATKDAIKTIQMLVTQENVGTIVIGESVASNGVQNDVAQAVRQYAKKIEQATGIVVTFQREDFSSVEAHRYQVDSGRRDDSAAAIILQRFLDRQKRS